MKLYFKYYYILLFVLSFASCMMTENSCNDCLYRDLTPKELALKKTLSSNLSNVYIFRMSYNYRKNSITCCEDVNNYNITILDQDTILLNNIDSSDSYATKLACYIYKEILFDSLRFSIKNIQIEMSNFNKNSLHPKGFEYCVEFKKENLESFFGKKIVQGKNNYKWVKISKKKDLEITRGNGLDFMENNSKLY